MLEGKGRGAVVAVVVFCAPVYKGEKMLLTFRSLVINKITVFKGEVTAFAQYLGGEETAFVQPSVDKDGKFVE